MTLIGIGRSEKETYRGSARIGGDCQNRRNCQRSPKRRVNRKGREGTQRGSARTRSRGSMQSFDGLNGHSIDFTRSSNPRRRRFKAAIEAVSQLNKIGRRKTFIESQELKTEEPKI